MSSESFAAQLAAAKNDIQAWLNSLNAEEQKQACDWLAAKVSNTPTAAEQKPISSSPADTWKPVLAVRMTEAPPNSKKVYNVYHDCETNAVWEREANGDYGRWLGYFQNDTLCLKRTRRIGSYAGLDEPDDY